MYLQLYHQVYDKLVQSNEKLNCIDAKIFNMSQNYTRECLEREKYIREKLQNNAKNQMRVQAFIDIAKAHTYRTNASLTPIEFDSKTLSRLSVQIDNTSRDDFFAGKLYTEATGQLLYLKEEAHSIEADACFKNTVEEKNYYDKEASLKQQKMLLQEEIMSYLNSEQFQTFATEIQENYQMFSENGLGILSDVPKAMGIGTMNVPFPIATQFNNVIRSSVGELYNFDRKEVGIPLNIDLSRGSVVLVQYCNETEQIMFKGIQNIIFNIIRYYKEQFEEIFYIDPVRFNNTTLGCLASFAIDERSYIKKVPSSMEEIQRTIYALLEKNREEDQQDYSKQQSSRRLIVVHDFPQAYDSTVINRIQELSVNAERYGITVILTNNSSFSRNVYSDVLNYLQQMATNIFVNDLEFYICLKEMNDRSRFDWYCAPKQLPESLKEQYFSETIKVDFSNDYHGRVGILDIPQYKKGVRQLVDIPYGIDEEGNLLTVDFENSNFATFICGASRSGKSTLLHTLLTGMIQKNHPDDVEIWLIDFKMTEFSRYIEHLPPHVRYIILDESPELVYDIIDRLTEIMQKRQNIFKGKWQKLNDVPPEKYMPAILVVIDEFSVMSQIIADSVMNSKENYGMKLQTLLAKGAALGLHFIFASQGFTSGTRGLNDFSKKQIQQRIAMKTEYAEIKATLDLKSANDKDMQLMEHLAVHHALVRVPMNYQGNQLCQSKVLYIEDYSKQEEMIDRLPLVVTAKPRYDVYDTHAYIDKKPMVIDGNSYHSFEDKVSLIQEHIQKYGNGFLQGEEAMVILGEPRRMLSIYPISIVNSFCENVLMIADISEKMASASVLLTMIESLRIQDIEVSMWSSRRNSIYRQLTSECGKRFKKSALDIEEICIQIKQIREDIQAQKRRNRFFVLLGFEDIILDMSYQKDNTMATKYTVTSDSVLNTTYEKRKSGQMDLLSQMAALESGVVSKIENKTVVNVEKTIDDTKHGIYDAREDLRYILTHGPRLGYHFIMVFNTVTELGQNKIDIALFKHRILFRISKSDAVGLVGSGAASVVAELEKHSFRYSNGLEGLSFRPYLHQGLTWDGWNYDENGVVNSVEEEEEYLI